jgi:hypothetical protein
LGCTSFSPQFEGAPDCKSCGVFFIKEFPLLSEKRILEGRIERKSNVYSLYLHRILLSASVLHSKDFCLFQVQETSKEEEGEAVEEKVKVRFKLLSIKFRFSYLLFGISVLSCPQPRIFILRLGIV